MAVSEEQTTEFVITTYMDFTLTSDQSSHVGSRIPPMFAKIGVILVVTFGIIGNGIILKVYVTSKQLRTPSNLFIVNLAIGDLTFLLVSTTTIHTMMQDGEMLYGETGCKVLAFMIITSAVVSLNTMAVIAISRYMVIVHPQKKHLLSWRTCTITCVFTWLYGSIIMVPTFTGWGRVGYTGVEWTCAFDWSFNVTYSVLVFCFTQGLTSAVMCFCYARILIAFKASKRRVTVKNSISKKEKETNRQDIRLAIQLFVVFAIYNLCWGPYFLIVVLIDPTGRIATWVYGLIYIFVFLNFSVNVLVYLYYNRVFRIQCYKLFGIQMETFGGSTLGTNSQ